MGFKLARRLKKEVENSERICLTFVVETKQADEGAVRGPEWRLILLWSQWFEVGQLGWAGR